MVELERVLLLIDGAERAITRYQSMEAPTLADSAMTFGELLSSLAYYRERFEATQ